MNLYRVNYTYVAPTGQLRSGAVVVQAESPTEAERLGEAKIPTNHQWATIVSTAPYGKTPTQLEANGGRSKK